MLPSTFYREYEETHYLASNVVQNMKAPKSIHYAIGMRNSLDSTER